LLNPGPQTCKAYTVPLSYIFSESNYLDLPCIIQIVKEETHKERTLLLATQLMTIIYLVLFAIRSCVSFFLLDYKLHENQT
jgi:uncharacterized membrane protein YozB (DUF420 family)